MDPHNAGDLKLLADTYRGLPPDAAVAFVDESYRLPAECRPGERPFYGIAAVVLPIRAHPSTRNDLRTIAAGTWWHTVDLQQSTEGRARIARMTDYLARFGDPCVIAVRHTPDDQEQAIGMRAASLTALLAALGGRRLDTNANDRREDTGSHPGASPPLLLPSTRMMVLEKQRRREDIQRDQHTIKRARQDGLIGRHYQVRHVSPAIEHLLWLADLVSHTYRRYITHGDDLVTRLDAQTITIDVPGKQSDPLGAAAYVQGVSRPFR